MQNEENIHLTLEEKLTLALISLSSFKENNRNVFDEPEEETILRAWKAYSFEVLNNLGRYGLIDEGKARNKSLYLLPEGQDLAQEIIEILKKSL